MGLGELFSLLSAAVWAVGVILYRQLGASLPPLQLNLVKNLLVLGMVALAIPLAGCGEEEQGPSSSSAASAPGSGGPLAWVWPGR